MLDLTCPSCGAAVTFKSRFSALSVCSFCKSVLLREGKNLTYSGKMAELSEDMTVLQIGTKGNIGPNSFEIIGRVKVDWEEGFWNEWYLVQNDGLQAWIAEAMGFYNYSYEYALAEILSPPHLYEIGDKITLQNREYIISDIKQFTCEGCTGELPFEIKPGMTGISFDLKTDNECCAYLEYSQERYRAFIGKLVSFEDLNLTNLREIDGW